jgi:flagellar hook assembly protein FlgD
MISVLSTDSLHEEALGRSKQNDPANRSHRNPTTTITFALPVEDYVKLVVYDMLGREVKTLVDGNCSAGYHSVELDGSRLSSGMYFYRLQVGSYIEIKKMQLLK